jgi:hypothetical protein
MIGDGLEMPFITVNGTKKPVAHARDCPRARSRWRIWEWPIGMPIGLVRRVCRSNGIRRCEECDPLREKVSV